MHCLTLIGCFRLSFGILSLIRLVRIRVASGHQNKGLNFLNFGQKWIKLYFDEKMNKNYRVISATTFLFIDFLICRKGEINLEFRQVRAKLIKKVECPV